MNKKRTLSILLACALLCSMASCGNSSPNGTDSSSQTTTAETTTAATTTAAETTAASTTATETVTEPAPTDDPGETEPEVNTLGGKPWIDSDIKANITADTKTDPKDDFHLYANKEWILKNNIPDGYTSWSHYDERDAEIQEECIALLKDKSIKGHDAELIRTYYDLILDWDARDKAGISEYEEVFKKLKDIKTLDDITALITDKDVMDELLPLVSYSANTGLNDPELIIVDICPTELMLQDSAEYKERTELGDMYYGYLKEKTAYLADRFGLSAEEAEKCFENAISFETRLSEEVYTTQEQYSEDIYDMINNEMTFKELTSRCKAFPLKEILKVSGYKYDGAYLVERPGYLDLLDKLYTEENVEEIKSLLLTRYLISCSGKLDRAEYDFSADALSRHFGIAGQLPDEEMAYASVKKSLPTSMQKVYISKYSSEEDKKKMEDLCKMVIDTYRELLSENEWASDEVKNYAIEKLDNIIINAAYPDKFRDTSALDLSGCTLAEACRRIAKDSMEYNKSLIGTKPSDEMWAEDMDILECNAYYDVYSNSVNMIIGMMGEPFFSSDMSTEELYASIGAFWVGHEISHAFDSNGSQFDEEGNYRNWWTDEDAEKFAQRIQKVDDYLSSIIAFDDKHFVGENIDTEMVADITGLQCALRMASKVEGFDYDKFFTKYAQMNTRLNLYSNELSLLMQDPHPLEYSRTNVPVQQFEEFYETYGIKEGDNMYLAPEDRITVW